MSENNYGALMMKRALPTTTDLKTITDPGIYPVNAGNGTAPVSATGTLLVYPSKTTPTVKFVSADVISWTLINDAWKKTTAADVSAVPTTGGDVGYLNNAQHYAIKPGAWEGAGSIDVQYTSPVAPFLIPVGHVADKDVSQYAPIVKGLIQTKELGYGTAVSFGILTAGDATFANACISVIGDSGVKATWIFNPNTGAFYSPGDITTPNSVIAGSVSAAGDVHSDRNISSNGFIQSNAGVYDTPGKRCYSENYIPTADVLNVIARDVCSAAGFVSANANDPYMRHSTSNEVVILARRDWVQNNYATSTSLQAEIAATREWANTDLRNDIYAYGDNRYVSDVALGAQGSKIVDNNPPTVPDGCVMTGWLFEGQNPGGDTIYYRPIQKRIPSQGWVTIGHTA